MRTFTLKGLFLTTVFLVLGCLAIHAADDDLITRQITIKLDQAGTLPDKIGSTRKYKLTNIKIVGEINGTDLCFIREMAGRDVRGEVTGGKLAILDLSEAKIVKGGGSYSYYHSYYYTSDDVVGNYAFWNCRGLTSVTLPSSVTSIGSFAFSGCSGLTSVTIPSGVTSIGSSVFEDCSGLTSIPLPSSVTSIGSSAFRDCRGLTSVTLPSSVTSIGDDAFWGCSGLTSITLPSSVTSIGSYAFYNCSGLTSIPLPSSVTSIGSYAFYNCSGLTSVTLPSSVTSIGDFAFYNCSGLTSVTIPSSVTSIGDDAFYGCSGLASVYVSWESPLSINASIFTNVNTKKCILYVPKGTYDDYFISNWGECFDNIEEYDATGINQVTTSDDVKEVSRYSVNGQRLEVPTKGLNIVKYSDGSVKKVVVQ